MRSTRRAIADGASMLNRRAFVAGVGAGLLGLPLVGAAQQPGRVWRVGFFYFGARESSLSEGRYRAFVDGMRALGYTEGRNLVIESRFAESDAERLGGAAVVVEEVVERSVLPVVAVGGLPEAERSKANLH